MPGGNFGRIVNTLYLFFLTDSIIQCYCTPKISPHELMTKRTKTLRSFFFILSRFKYKQSIFANVLKLYMCQNTNKSLFQKIKYIQINQTRNINYQTCSDSIDWEPSVQEPWWDLLFISIRLSMWSIYICCYLIL